MKLFETHFEDYLASHAKQPLHPKLADLYATFPPQLADFKNLVFYGPKGVGKYTQMLAAIQRYSPTGLKYEKKISVLYNKNTYYYKISDLHFEIDMALLGCHAKMLFNEVYNNIVDIVLAKADKFGIIVCKNFHDIHGELLDIFYNYMQKFNNPTVQLTFVLLTEELSFIPDNIINCVQVIKVPRPSRLLYNKCLQQQVGKELALADISNMKNVHAALPQMMRPHAVTCDKILDEMLQPAHKPVNFLLLRDMLYDIFIYNLDVMECVWYLVDQLVQQRRLTAFADVSAVLMKTYRFMQYYNNNYRPIYHLENYVLFLMLKVAAQEPAAQASTMTTVSSTTSS